MAKPVVFISHVHEDGQIASCLKEFLEEAFLGTFRTFVSSDGASIRAGDNWSSAIEQGLMEASIVLALITESAKDRRWIYFECGGAYFSRKRVIPICCRNFPVLDLPQPMSWLQAVDGSTLRGVELLVQAVADTFELRRPNCDAARLSSYLLGLPCAAPAVATDANVKQRPFPLYLVVDTSGSMAGEPLLRLTESIKSLLDDLSQESSGSVAPLISIISFGGEAKEIISLSPLSSSVLSFTLHAAGSTELGSALRLLASRLADESQLPTRFVRPMIMVFTDGSPTDDWRSGLTALNATRLGSVARKIGVAYGEYADLEVLKEIAGDSVVSVPNIGNIRGLSTFFKWASSSVRTLSQSAGDALANELELPPLPAGLVQDTF